MALIAVSVGVALGIYKFISKGPITETRNVPFFGSDMTRLTTTGRSKRGAAISPDGKYVAHILSGTDGESLWVRQVAVANDTRLAAPSDSYIVWVTFSPDGNFVYYLSLERDKGETEMFRVPVLGGPTVKIANDIGAPEISPDGTKIAFMITNQEETRLIVTNIDGTNQDLLMSRTAPDYLNPGEVVLVSRKNPDYLNMYWYAPAWSPDGKSIAFPVNQSDEKGRYETVMAVDVETRVERKLTDERWQQVGQARWLADGLVVSAAETPIGSKQLWHISLTDGAAARITRDLNDYQYLNLTSDSQTLAVVQNHTVSNIWTVGGDGSAAKQIMSEAGWLNELIWLPDGRLAYTSNAGGSSDVWVMNADGTGIRQLTVGANARLGLAVTADEKQLIFAAERDGKYNLWRINIDGSNLERITNGDGELYPQCTPDGRWIVYQSGGSYPTIWKMPIGGGEAVAITKTTGSRPSISPDGKLVAYHYLDSSFERSRWGIGISSLEDGKRVKRFDFPSTVVERLVKWTRDGSGIAFLNSPGGVHNIWIQPIDGGASKPLTDFTSDNIISFNWNADGSQLGVIRAVETSDVLLINRSSK
ncbi:MAG: PD40 domain-containing protein [Chloracidobacterium sp.]|nr:PD40 domain-containing protein [Chloracidobacterium sp.]